ncbi:DUF881 domain-containing protein [Cellulomonas sp. 179-A 9B4 NHS]|uniref:DUF881 domain-containing protein n=1 Tax=Cellulomonas sp. 179-A 9B4 NHS TaxID=3142379 RepID=UPI0039A127DF
MTGDASDATPADRPPGDRVVPTDDVVAAEGPDAAGDLGADDAVPLARADDRDARTAATDDAPAIDPRDPLGLGDLGWDVAAGDERVRGEDLVVDDRQVEGLALDDPALDDPAVDDLAVDGATPDGATPDGATPDGATPDGPAPDGPGPVAVAADAAHRSDAAEVAHERGGVEAREEPPSTSTVVPLADRAPDLPDDAAVGARRDEDVAADGTGVVPVAAPPEPVRHERPPGERSAWARLAHAMRPRTTAGQLLTAALCALLGFALVVQVRQTTDTQLGSLRQDDLVRLLDETTTRADELAQEAADLQREHDELLSGSDRQQAALDAARRNAATQGILTGRLPATGPGVRVTLTETSPSIRAATMLHVLEELRNAGAEAIQVNDRRVTASSAFTGAPGEIVLDGVTLSPPYRWLVIGEPDTIATALEIPGGAVAKVRTDGGRGTVETLERVDVTALRELPEPVHATPVPDGG